MTPGFPLALLPDLMADLQGKPDADQGIMWSGGWRAAWAALNPQPLPPGGGFRHAGPGRVQVHQIAGWIIDDILLALDRLDYEGEGATDRAVPVMQKQVTLLAGWCGTVPVTERLRELLKRLGKRWPPIPDPDPQPNWASLVLAASHFARAAAIVQEPRLAEAFAAGAQKVLQAALEKAPR